MFILQLVLVGIAHLLSCSPPVILYVFYSSVSRVMHIKNGSRRHRALVAHFVIWALLLYFRLQSINLHNTRQDTLCTHDSKLSSSNELILAATQPLDRAQWRFLKLRIFFKGMTVQDLRVATPFTHMKNASLLPTKMQYCKNLGCIDLFSGKMQSALFWETQGHLNENYLYVDETRTIRKSTARCVRRHGWSKKNVIFGKENARQRWLWILTRQKKRVSLDVSARIFASHLCTWSLSS